MKLAVPDMISNSYFPAEAAVELGFFKAEGLDVELELIFPVDKAYAALRDGAVDFVGGSAHSALAAFPRFQGAKLICAQAQGMYWFLILHADLGAKRGDGPKACFNYTAATIATSDALIARAPDAATAAVRAVAKTQAALKADVTQAKKVGDKLFPPSEAALITDLIRRDLPYYDATLSRDFFAGMSAFARKQNILDSDLVYENVVATQFSSLWKV
jgi:ABC-type nitrate/sulfonate/bicarbonate transport system substrate-binding protein